MNTDQQAKLTHQAFVEIEQLFDNYDFGGQIESALPLLNRHRQTLATLYSILQPVRGAQQPRHDERWVDDLVATYRQLGGKAVHSAVYQHMKKTRLVAGRSWPEHGEEAIRQTLQAYCAESPQYSGGADLFRMVCRGLWGLKGSN